jgi:site-specific recombinase XerD
MKYLTEQNSPLINSNLTERAQKYNEAAQGAFSENTDRARKADWKIFESWCQDNNQRSLPSSTDTLVDFIDAQSEIKRPSTVKRYLTTIATAHKVAGIRNPVQDEFVRLAVRRMTRKKGTRQKQAKGFNWPQINLALQTLDESPRSLLDKALICTSYDTLCRRSETVAIQFDDITFAEDGSATVHIIRSKTDQTSEGSIRYLSNTSVDCLKQWLEFSQIKKGFIFRGINRWGHVSSKALSTEGVSRSFKRIAQHVGLNIQNISGHSTRVGACQDLVSAGIDLSAVMQAGGWKTPERVARYSEHLQVKQGGMAQLAVIQRRR